MNFNLFVVYFFESVSIFMCLYFFILYFIIRRKDHLFYALFLLSLAIYYLLALPDYFFGVQAGEQERVNNFNLFKRPLQFLCSVFYTYFVIYYLGLNRKADRTLSFFKTLIGIYLLSSFVSLLLNYFKVPYDREYYFFSILLFPVQLIAVAVLFKSRVAYSKYIILGSMITILGSALSMAMTIYISKHPEEMFQKTFNIFLPTQICMAIDMILFSIALQKKIADNEKSLISTAFQRQRAVMAERERIIADLHDDVGGGISSIRMMSDLMAQHGSSFDDPNYAAFPQKISKTAREVALRMHTIIWSLNEENDTLGNFAEYVRQFGLSFFENTGIVFTFSASTDLPAGRQLSGVQRKELFLVIKEALHNVLKHATANKVAVIMGMQGDRLEIIVEDNGKGIPDQHIQINGFGNGLKNMQKRMDEIGGKLLISSSNGTRIAISVELGRNT